MVSPTRNSSRFTSYEEWLATRAAVLADFESHFGITLEQPLPARSAEVVFEHGRPLGEGWRGRPGTQTAPQRFSIQDPVPSSEISRTKTTLRWTDGRWKPVQHFPTNADASPWRIVP
jgi:hypothetical protein